MPVFSLIFGLLIALSQGATSAPNKDFPQPTFLVKPVSATVKRGHESDVVAEVVPAYGGDVLFQISRPPQFGSLTKAGKLGPSSQIFHYINDRKYQVQSDSFEFRVKAPGHTWNTYTASLVIENPPGTLVVLPTTLDFGRVPIGSSIQKKIMLSNSFGDPIAGTLLIPSPWSISDEGHFSLSEGESQSVSIQFSPIGSMSYTSTLTAAPQISNFPIISVLGTGVAPFLLSSTSAIVSSENPVASFLVSNNYHMPMTVSWSGDASLCFSPPAVIPPNSVVSMWVSMTRLHLPVEDKKQFYPVLQNGPYTQQLEVFAMGPKGSVTLEPLSGAAHNEVLSAKLGNPVTLNGIIHNKSSANRLIDLFISDQSGPHPTTSLPVRSLSIRAGENLSFSLPWSPKVPGLTSPSLYCMERGTQLCSANWQFLIEPIEVKKPSLSPVIHSPEAYSYNRQMAETIPDSTIHLITDKEKQMMTAWLPPRFEDGIITRTLVLRWIFVGSPNSRFLIQEHNVVNALTNRTGESSDEWKPIVLNKKPKQSGDNGVWEQKLSMPFPGSHDYLITTDVPGEKITAVLTVTISWWMYLMPILRLATIVFLGVILLKIIRRRNL